MNETGIFNETNSNGYRYHSQLICIAVFIRILMSGLKPDPPAADHFREFYTQILHFLRKRTDNTSDAADMTGHALLHTLYQANLKAGTVFLNEYTVSIWLRTRLAISSA